MFAVTALPYCSFLSSAPQPCKQLLHAAALFLQKLDKVALTAAFGSFLHKGSRNRMPELLDIFEKLHGSVTRNKIFGVFACMSTWS